MQITEHFSSEEFAQPARHGFETVAYPQEWVRGRLQLLCEVLEVIRAELGGKPIQILSGYRSLAYNRAIGGARQSQHMEGRAADVQIEGVSPSKVHAVILRLYNEQKIKIGGLGQYPTFIHVDIRQGNRLARWGGSRSDS